MRRKNALNAGQILILCFNWNLSLIIRRVKILNLIETIYIKFIRKHDNQYFKKTNKIDKII